MGGAKRYRSTSVRVAMGSLRSTHRRKQDYRLAAHCARGLPLRLPSLVRGRREDRVLAAPAVSRAICENKTAHEHTGAAGSIRPSLRNGFTAYFVLFPENGSFASVARGLITP